MQDSDIHINRNNIIINLDKNMLKKQIWQKHRAYDENDEVCISSYFLIIHPKTPK
jgi:hypothetical protein